MNLAGLASHGLQPDNIDHVVCTHGHSDHVGNLNLFLNARHIVGFDVCQKDLYTDHPFSEVNRNHLHCATSHSQLVSLWVVTACNVIFGFYSSWLRGYNLKFVNTFVLNGIRYASLF